MSRHYTFDEIRRMRNAVISLHAKDGPVEEILRTYMANETDPSELEREFARMADPVQALQIELQRLNDDIQRMNAGRQNCNSGPQPYTWQDITNGQRRNKS